MEQALTQLEVEKLSDDTLAHSLCHVTYVTLSGL